LDQVNKYFVLTFEEDEFDLLESKKNELNDSESKLNDSKTELNDSESELNDSENEFNSDAMLFGTIRQLEDKEFDFLNGEKFPFESISVPVNLEVHIYSDRGRMTDNLYVDDLGTVFSNRAKQIFDSLNIESIDFIPLSITDDYSNLEEVIIAKFQKKELEYEAIVYNNYHISNVNLTIDCVDHQNSDIDFFVSRYEVPDDLPQEMKELLNKEEPDNDIDFIRHLVLEDSKIPEEVKIFRLKDCPRILVFKTEVVEVIKNAGLTGFVFVPLEEYTEEIPDYDDDEIYDILKGEPTPEDIEFQKIAAIKKERQSAYEAMQERIRQRRASGEGPSLV